jgi:hypothetical protein
MEIGLYTFVEATPGQAVSPKQRAVYLCEGMERLRTHARSSYGVGPSSVTPLGV